MQGKKPLLDLLVFFFPVSTTKVKGRFTIHPRQSRPTLCHVGTAAILPSKLTEGLQKQGTAAQNSGKPRKSCLPPPVKSRRKKQDVGSVYPRQPPEKHPPLCSSTTCHGLSLFRLWKTVQVFIIPVQQSNFLKSHYYASNIFSETGGTIHNNVRTVHGFFNLFFLNLHLIMLLTRSTQWVTFTAFIARDIHQKAFTKTTLTITMYARTQVKFWIKCLSFKGNLWPCATI